MLLEIQDISKSYSKKGTVLDHISDERRNIWTAWTKRCRKNDVNEYYDGKFAARWRLCHVQWRGY